MTTTQHRKTHCNSLTSVRLLNTPCAAQTCHSSLSFIPTRLFDSSPHDRTTPCSDHLPSFARSPFASFPLRRHSCSCPVEATGLRTSIMPDVVETISRESYENIKKEVRILVIIPLLLLSSCSWQLSRPSSIRRCPPSDAKHVAGAPDGEYAP